MVKKLTQVISSTRPRFASDPRTEPTPLELLKFLYRIDVLQARLDHDDFIERVYYDENPNITNKVDLGAATGKYHLAFRWVLPAEPRLPGHLLDGRSGSRRSCLEARRASLFFNTSPGVTGRGKLEHIDWAMQKLGRRLRSLRNGLGVRSQQGLQDRPCDRPRRPDSREAEPSRQPPSSGVHPGA